MSDHAVSTTESCSRRSLIVQAVVVVSLIAALVGVLAIMEPSDKGSEVVPEQSQVFAPPKLGVTVSTASSSSLAPALKNEIAQVPNVAEAAIESGAVSGDLSPVSRSQVPIVPEGSNDPTMSAPEGSVQAYRSKLVVSQASESRVAASSSSALMSSATSSSLRPNLAPQSDAVAGFTIQLGVFNNLGNAEALHQKLKIAGIYSHMETRVQIGPFNTKEEAEKVQGKLKRLGLATGMMVPVAKKRD